MCLKGAIIFQVDGAIYGARIAVLAESNEFGTMASSSWLISDDFVF